MIGSLLVYAALVTSLAGVAAIAYGFYRGEADGPNRPARFLTGATAAFLALAVFYLGYQFVATDYTNGYVWSHTGDYLPLEYRLSGMFAGTGGGWLLWSWFVSIVSGWLVARAPKTDSPRPIAFVAALVTTVFVVLLATHPPFTPVELPRSGPIVGPEGLNPLLIHPYMIVHPPVTFGAYALTVVPFSVAIGDLWRRVRERPGVFDEWAGSVQLALLGAWTLLTASIALGAFWSYYTVGWGGLWDWDPVQTATLVTWLLLVGGIHAVEEHRRHETQPILAPTLAALSFPAVLFARVVTQSGILSSVHAFGSQLNALLVALFFVSTCATIGGGLLLAVRGDSRSETTGDSPPSTLFLAAGVVSILAFVYLVGIVVPMGYELLTDESVSFETTFYTIWSYPVLLAGLLLLGYDGHVRIGGRNPVRTVAAVVLLTGIVAVVPIPDWSLAPEPAGTARSFVGRANPVSLVIPALYAFTATVARLERGRRTGLASKGAVSLLGTVLIHVALVVLVLSLPITALGTTGGDAVVAIDENGSAEPAEVEGRPYSVSVHGTSVDRVPAAPSFAPAERDLLGERIHDVGQPANATLPSEGSTILWGEVVERELESAVVSYRFAGTDVWVTVRSDGGNDRESTAPFETGTTVYVQGQINETADRLVIETTDDYVGDEPTDAIVPVRRTTVTRASLTVTEDGESVTDGTVGIRSYAGQGSTVDALVGTNARADTYVVPDQISIEDRWTVVTVRVRTIPFMNVVRGGVVLLLLGGVIRLGASVPPCSRK